MNFRQIFEAWHQRAYGYVSPGKGTAMNYTYTQPTMQARWEAWQASASQCNKEFNALRIANLS